MFELPQRNLELEAAAFADLHDLDAWRVFADWLLSVGDPRGELASTSLRREGGFASERRALAARFRELERPLIDAWQVWAQDRDLLDVKLELQRGFVHAVTGPLVQLRPVLDELFEREPVQRLILTGVEPADFVRLCDRQPPWFERLRYLKLSGTLAVSGSAALASVPLTSLRRLNLLDTDIDDDACVSLARLRAPALTHLTLTANLIGKHGLGVLLGAETRGRWRELYLSGNPLGGAIARLATDTGLRSLTGLYMVDVMAELSEFTPLADPANLPALRRLELSSWGWRQHRELRDRLRERLGAGLRLV